VNRDKEVDPVSSKKYEPKKVYEPIKRCFEGHPPLALRDGLVIHGGSCISPAVTDADVYIGFDAGMKKTARLYPWTEGVEVPFPIPDGRSFKEMTHFDKLVDWTIGQLEAGRKVHCGCIGGHGRTGTFFAVLVNRMMDEKAAAAYVRQHYCSKAIETTEQITWLHQTYGIDTVDPRPHWHTTHGHANGSNRDWSTAKGVSKQKAFNYKTKTPDEGDEFWDLQAEQQVAKKIAEIKASATTGTPPKMTTSIWGTTRVTGT
jgi:hypothetical protein